MLTRPDQEIGTVLRGTVDVPSLPIVIQRLLALPESGADLRDFVELVAADQGLASRVLRLVNSAFYSLRTPLGSLPHAASILGVKTLRSMALGISVMDIFRGSCEGFDPTRFWRHAIAVASCSRAVASRVLDDGAEEPMYVAGLLHDIGVVLLAQYAPRDYPLALRLACDEHRQLAAVEKQLFGMDHCEVGSSLATRWRFPAEIGLAIRSHEEAYSGAADGETDKRMCDVVRFAELWASRAGHWFLALPEDDSASSLDAPPWFAEVDPDWDQALAEAEHQLERALPLCEPDESESVITETRAG